MTIEVPARLSPRGSVRSAPPRRPGSVRRTTTMDFTWPDGMAGHTVLDGQARDLRTGPDGAATVVARAALSVASDPRRLISSISAALGPWTSPGPQLPPGPRSLAGSRSAPVSPSSSGRQAPADRVTLPGPEPVSPVRVSPVRVSPESLSPQTPSPEALSGPEALLSGPEALSGPEILSALQSLIGESAMSGFRRRLAAVIGNGGWVTGTPLFQLLDDLPGATLVSGAAWQRWHDMDSYLEVKRDVRQRVMRDVCTGYQEGSSALNLDGTLRWQQDRPPAVDIDDVDDDEAWHPHARPSGVTMRRARRIDVWAVGDVLHIDAFFQDSSSLPEGGRQAIHEYTLSALADLETGTLRSVTPVPQVLPYTECPLAVENVGALAGVPLSDLRSQVLQRLAGPLGCTHLNDMMRALAGVPELARHLPQQKRI
jgi:hypothetical protein